MHLIGISVECKKITKDLVIEVIQSSAKTIEHNKTYLLSTLEEEFHYAQSTGYNKSKLMLDDYYCGIISIKKRRSVKE
ncbi:hypothetical protein FDF06_04075 [Clostridium botulinum]|nr:hypothetical protein [Clostridium botulinum]